MKDHELMPAINALERRVVEAEQKASGLLDALNALREEVGLKPRPPGSGNSSPDSNSETQIMSDTFFGRPQQTAVREYLDMRRAQGLDGPATPREIYEALVEGGFKYEAKDDETALVGLRAMLRKRTNVFVKIGKKYGLVSWYPDVKRSKASSKSDDDSDLDDDNDDEEETETTAHRNDGAAVA